MLDVNISLKIFLLVLDTAISFDAEIPFEDAVISVAPSIIAMTSPDELISAIFGSEEDHSTSILSKRFPSLSYPLA